MEPQYIDDVLSPYNPYNAFDIIEDQKQIIKKLKQEIQQLKTKLRESEKDTENYKKLYEDALRLLNYRY